MATFLVLRPLNIVIAGVSVFIGALLTHQPLDKNVLLTCISCLLITGAGNSMNDYADSDIDAINKPYRPIPSGRLSKKYVLYLSAALFIIGVSIARIVSVWLFNIAFLVVLLLLLYNFNLKRRGLPGNFAVAIMGGLPFVCGGISVSSISPTAFPFLFAFLFHLAREILKDVEDMKGDMKYAVTFPIKYGRSKGIILSSFIMISLIICTVLPFISQIYGIYYLIAVLLLVDLPLIWIIVIVVKDRLPLHRVNTVLKYDMILGMITLSLGYFK